MATREEWCADKLSKLLNEDLRISTLNEIKTHFEGISDTEAMQTAELLELPLVFDCLNDSNQEQVDLACEVLSLCMEKLDIGEAALRYTIPLERALTHPNPGVKVMALDELSRILNCSSQQRNTLVNNLCKANIFANVVKCIGDDDLKVGARSVGIVSSFSALNPDCILSANIIQIMKETMAKNEVVRLRFYELFITISVESETAHGSIVRRGLLAPMLEEINTNDVLLRLNIIEMLTTLVQKDYGYAYLKREGFIDKIFRLFINEADPIFLQLCEPGILKFYGHMAECKPAEAFEKYPEVINKVFDNLSSSDYTVLKVSLETLGYISRSDKLVLDSFVGFQMISALKSMAERLQTFPTEVKLLVLTWLEDLLAIHHQNGVKNDSKIALKWFSSFGENAMDLIMNYVKNPFEEMRLAGLKVLTALTMHNWGQDKIKTYPALIELLLDRGAESFKSTKDQKYALVKSLHDNDFGVFDEETKRRFEAFVIEGPHYVRAVTEIAIEGNE